jgi:hypothetical protein
MTKGSCCIPRASPVFVKKEEEEGGSCNVSHSDRVQIYKHIFFCGVLKMICTLQIATSNSYAAGMELTATACAGDQGCHFFFLVLLFGSTTR